MEQPLYISVVHLFRVYSHYRCRADPYTVYTLIYNVYQQIDEMSPEATANTLARYYIVV